MTEKEIKKLNRQDLLILLAEQRARADKLEEKLKKAEDALQERKLAQEECGSMAEAALKLSAVFQAADAAAALYLENIQKAKDHQVTACQEMETASQKKCEEILRRAEDDAARKREEAEQLLLNARQEANEIIVQARDAAQQEQQRAEEMIRKAQETVAQETAKIDERWNEIYDRICGMEREYSWLRGIINKNPGDR